MTRKVIDCFTFYNEVQMLEFRLEELGDFVDFFVIVEADTTHSGEKKGKNFPENSVYVDKYRDKIVYVYVEDMPDGDDAWEREIHQRDCISRGLKDIDVNPDDLLIISDCDEIPDVSSIPYLFEIDFDNVGGYICLEQDMYYYNLSTKATNKWYHSKVCTYSRFMQAKDTNEIRLGGFPAMLRNGGWHFSYFGGIDMIKNKIKNFAHQEFNTSEFTDESRISEAIENNIDLFRRPGIDYAKVDIDKNDYLPKNYKMLI
jgi:beta-1,4-mannosyl-glycoprotein beta-1,4-N-acetylglucosaminyltransferase